MPLGDLYCVSSIMKQACSIRRCLCAGLLLFQGSSFRAVWRKTGCLSGVCSSVCCTWLLVRCTQRISVHIALLPGQKALPKSSETTGDHRIISVHTQVISRNSWYGKITMSQSGSAMTLSSSASQGIAPASGKTGDAEKKHRPMV